MPIQFGRWHPDALGLDTPILTQAINCVANASGFRPLRSPAAVSDALPTGDCFGAATVLQLNGRPRSYAGTRTKLYLLQADGTWLDLTRATGGDYLTGDGERWKYVDYGDLIIATNFADAPQKASISAATAFEALGGSPPVARHIDVVRDFVVLACIPNGNENRIQWSGLNNAEQWTPGVNFSDFQDFPRGGPITGIIGGEVGYVFQRDRVYRMTYVPGSDFVFQFDEIESGIGLAYPNSLVKYGQYAYYLADDGLYRMNLISGAAEPVGVGKFHEFIQDDIKKGAEQFVYGAFSPSNDAILWSYPRLGSPSQTVPDRVLWYTPHVDEAATADLSIVAVSQWLTEGYTMETIPAAFGDLDNLIAPLDSAFWKGGAPLLGIFLEDDRLSFFEGQNLQTIFETVDAQPGRRVLVRGIRPHIDTTDITIAVSGRERKGDTVSYENPERLEDTGVVPAWVSGNYLRARIVIDEGAVWNQMQGIEADATDAGVR